MTPVTNLVRPTRLSLGELPGVMNPAHGGVHILVYMRNHFPAVCSRKELIIAAGFCTGHIAARFEWWLMRINDSLPMAGWMIAEREERYWLTSVSDASFDRLVERHRRRYG